MADDFDPLEYETPKATFDIESPHFKRGTDVLSVAAKSVTALKLEDGGATVHLRGEKSEVKIWLDESVTRKLVQALTYVRVDINHELDKPTTCQVYVDGVMQFDGVDKSVLFQGKP